MQQLVAQILAAWRRAQRLVDDLDPDNPEHAKAVSAVDRLQALYLDLTGRDPTMSQKQAAALLVDLGE